MTAVLIKVKRDVLNNTGFWGPREASDTEHSNSWAGRGEEVAPRRPSQRLLETEASNLLL